MHPKILTILTTLLSLTLPASTHPSAMGAQTARLTSREVAEMGLVQTGLKVLHHGDTARGGYAMYGIDNGTLTGRRILIPTVETYNCTPEKYARFTCSPDNYMNSTSLTELLWNLRTYDAPANLDEGFKAFCAWRWGEYWNRACTSWHHDAGPVRVNWLWPAAKEINAVCNGNRGGFWEFARMSMRLAGTAYGVIIGTTCTHQCVSNRPDGCM